MKITILRCLLIIAGMTPIVAVVADDAVDSDAARIIEHCKTTSGDADRIACLEAALLDSKSMMTAATKTQADPVPSNGTEAQGIGASQVIARSLSKEEMRGQLEKVEGLAVAAYDTVPYERLLVTLVNGQVWRQITGDTQKIRVDLSRNQTVDISESPLGGYKMQLNEMRRTVRVERVR